VILINSKKKEQRNKDKVCLHSNTNNEENKSITKNLKNEQNNNILNEIIFSTLLAKMGNNSISNNNQNETINYNDEKILIFFYLINIELIII